MSDRIERIVALLNPNWYGPDWAFFDEFGVLRAAERERVEAVLAAAVKVDSDVT